MLLPSIVRLESVFIPESIFPDDKLPGAVEKFPAAGEKDLLGAVS